MMLLLVVSCLAALTGAGATVSKCIRREDTITFNCPKDHVVYQPIIFVGHSTRNKCSHSEGDCTGLTYDLKVQKNKCWWKRRCSLRWRDQQPILASRDTNCIMKMPNYVNMENPLCIPTERVYDVCDAPDLSKVEHGVVRSHSDFPWNYPASRKHCKLVLPAKTGHRLVLTVDDLDLDVARGDTFHIRNISLGKGEQLFKGTENKGTSLEVWNESEVEISYRVNVDEGETVAEKGGSGFVLRFEYKPLQTVGQSNTEVSELATNIFRESLFNVFGAIEECITPKREELNITCPPGHVIFKPEVKVGVSTDGHCSYRSGDCLGMTHTFLTQKNVCYWKGSCELSWMHGIPITMSKSFRCLSQPPKYLSFSGYRCIKEDEVVELCDKKTLLINGTLGLIKSHENYPWHYRAEKRSCRKRIRVPKNGILRMRSQDVDLDPDTKGDNIKLYHVRDHKRLLRQKVRGSKEIDESFSGGCVEINFRVSPRSKAGRGFVIKFETNVFSNEEPIFDDCGKQNEKRKRSEKRKNRRKNKGSKGKRRGKKSSGRSRNRKSRKNRKRPRG